MEQWLKITGFDNYEISNKGNVRSVDRLVNSHTSKTGKRIERGRVIKAQLSNRGYLRAEITSNDGQRKKYTIHRLVALLFIPNPENKETINHKNGNKEDNRIENLEWATQSENVTHSFRALGKKPNRTGLGRTGAKSVFSKPVICLNDGNAYESATEAGKKLNMRGWNIAAVCRGEQHTAGGLKFKYA